MNREHGLWGIALLALAGCMPVEQASLVYTSKEQIGVNVAAGTPDAPGLDLNVGYKGLDAAYVPVAVAKNCPQMEARDCTNLIYQLIRISGKNDVGNEDTLDRQRIDDLRKEVAEHSAQIEQVSRDIERDEEQLGEIARAGEERAALSTEIQTIDTVVGTGTPTAEQSARKAGISARIKAIDDAAGKRPEIEGRLVSNKALRDQQSASLARDQARLGRLEAERNSKNTDAKEDAFSVFGSFDGNASGSEDDAGIGVGKIFSTGVASQNLTQGMKEGVVLALRGKCMKTMQEAANMLTGDKRAELLMKIADVCMETPRSALQD
jgi:hypothetical protein